MKVPCHCGSLLTALLVVANAAPARAQTHGTHDMPMPMPSATADQAMPEMTEDPLMARAMRMGSGTSVLPATSPMRAWMVHAGDWMWMFYGDLVGGYNQQGGPRGAQTWAAENWQMAMGTRPFGPGLLDLRAMTSLEGLTLPPGGTPQLFQTGETYQGRPLLDKQHPHDLFMELSGRYTWNLAAGTEAFLYGGFPGEPALGPSAFMHRPSAMDNHWAPLGHHLQDSTHISFGVATAGIRWHALQLEASAFNGREPDENRFNFDLGPIDSWATRLSWFPGRNWSTQISYGRLARPEALEPWGIDRTTASVTHVGDTPLGRLATSLIWGQNLELRPTPRALQSYGVESQLDLGTLTHLYGRFELVDKEGLGLAANDEGSHRVGALTLGGVRDLGGLAGFDLGLGADATAYSLDEQVAAAYGFNPISFRVYLRMRPPAMM